MLIYLSLTSIFPKYTMAYKFTEIPFDKIESFGIRSMLYNDLFTVSWILGRFCNYACSYCWPYARSDTKDHRPTELLLSTIDEIKRQARENNFNSFHFSFSGGEPTLHSGYLEILDYIGNDVPNTNYTSCHMTSNCSPGPRWFQRYVDATKKFNRVSITCSLHLEYVNTPEKMQKLADKLIICQENDVHITINIVMVPSKFWESYEHAKFFHDQQINVTLKPQSDPTASFVVDGYTDEMMDILKNGMPQENFTVRKKKWFDRPKPNQYVHATESPNMQIELTDDDGQKWYIDQAERFNGLGFNKFKGWACNAGYQGIIIREPDGNIKRSYSCHDEPLGNIETGFQLFKHATKCITPSCVSSADSKIPKRKD